MSMKTNEYLTVAVDLELGEDQFIPKNTLVEIFDFDQQLRTDATMIVYQGDVLMYENSKFHEYK